MNRSDALATDLEALADLREDEAARSQRRAENAREEAVSRRTRAEAIRDGAVLTEEEERWSCETCGLLARSAECIATQPDPEQVRNWPVVPGVGRIPSGVEPVREVPVAYEYECPNGHTWVR